MSTWPISNVEKNLVRFLSLKYAADYLIYFGFIYPFMLQRSLLSNNPVFWKCKRNFICRNKRLSLSFERSKTGAVRGGNRVLYLRWMNKIRDQPTISNSAVRRTTRTRSISWRYSPELDECYCYISIYFKIIIRCAHQGRSVNLALLDDDFEVNRNIAI